MSENPQLPHHVVVLGSDGFIGSHLCEALLHAGVERLTGWDRQLQRTEALQARPNFVFRHADLRAGADLLVHDIEDADVVVNLAALCNPSLYGTRTIDVIESNFVHAEPIVRACARTGTRLVHLSTSEVFGRTLQTWAPNSVIAPDSPLETFDEEETPYLLGPLHRTRWSYACAKQLLERLIEAYGREQGLPWTIVRPFNFVGPRMDFLPGREAEGVPRVLACFVHALLEKSPMKLVDGGHARRAFLHISDAVDGIIRILERPEVCDKRVFHLGHPGNETDIRSLAILMRRIWSDLRQDPSVVDIPLLDIPSSEFYGNGYDDSDRRKPGIKNARTLLDWEPKLGLEEALRTTLCDYHERFPENPR